MKNFYISFRTLFKKGRHNDIKILSLGVGLAMGLVLIAKVCFELSYDNFYPESDRIFAIQENFSIGDKSNDGFPCVSGGVAPGMKAEIPGVVAATRCERTGEMVMKTPDNKKYTAIFMLADSCFFDVLPREMLVGNARETLSRPLYALVSEEMAGKINPDGADVIGKTFEVQTFPGVQITVGGVFKDVPKNTHLYYDVLVSLSTFKAITGWSKDDQWLGGDSFNAYVLLQPGLSADDMLQPMAEMLDRHVDSKKLKEQGMTYSIFLRPLGELYASSPATKRMAVMLTAIAFAILFAALMNYVLLVISSMVTRSKDVAIHKCYGATGWNITDMIFSEAFLNLLISVVFSTLLVFGFRRIVEELLGTSLSSLFTPDTLMILLSVCVLVFLVAGLLPSQLFARIPVALVFRSYTNSRRSWKKALLFIQFVAVGFLVCLLIVIGWQYSFMVNDNPGYSYERLAFCNLEGVPQSSRKALMDEIRKQGEVEDVTTCYELPAFSGSGDIVYRPGSEDAVAHFRDLYGTNANFVSLLEMKVIEGQAFDESYSDSMQLVMVSRQMATELANAFQWKDGVVGKKLDIGGHGTDDPFTVVGVYDDVRMGRIDQEGMVNSAIFFSKRAEQTLVVKFRERNAENLAHINNVIKEFLPDREINLIDYRFSLTKLYDTSRIFRDSVMAGGIITLIIALIGLIGYINDETNRRGKEIAVRKINGATERDILRLISSDIVWMALPAILIGAGASWFASEKWLQQFSEKIPMNAGLFLTGSVVVLAVILLTVVYRTWMVANANPVLSLKSE
ncbi:ABC transporter permease [Parabacteroides goldsteinii]|uniref:ABC transporter permease n=1 Tax=Parabacteroides goldsteinii TaxID=328812 RepID=UPI00101D2764|nr:ABC transporter permease [Parabacteroides goldsteinii]